MTSIRISNLAYYLQCQYYLNMSVYLNPDRSSNCSYILCNFSGAFSALRKVSIRLSHLTLCPLVRPSAWKNSVHTGPFFVNIYIGNFYSPLLRKFRFGSNRAKISGTSHEDVRTCMIIICWIFSARRNFSNKSYRTKSQHTFRVKNNSQKLCLLRDNYQKFVISRQAIGEHTSHGAKKYLHAGW
jgi:hypothetical protein